MESRSFYGDADPRELPLYSVSAAAHYIDMVPGTLRTWVAGRRYRVHNGWAVSDPLIQLPEGPGGRMSFNNLIEAYVLKALRRKHDAPMSAIRNALDYAENELGIERLLLRNELCTSAGDLFWDTFSNLINLSRGGQIAMREVLGAYLQRVDRDAADLPLKLYPLVSSRPEAKSIVIDPAVSFGRPILRHAGVGTAIIAQRVDAGEAIATLAEDYGLSEEAIRDAVVYEMAA